MSALRVVPSRPARSHGSHAEKAVCPQLEAVYGELSLNGDSRLRVLLNTAFNTVKPDFGLLPKHQCARPFSAAACQTRQGD